MKKEMNGVTAFATLLAAVVLFIFNAFVTFWIGYFLGWLAMKTVGSPLIYGLNCLFATTMFKETMLPFVAGGLNWIASFFRSSFSTKIIENLGK